MQTILITGQFGDTQHRISWAVSPMGLSQSALLVFLPLLVDLTGLSYSQWAQLFAQGMGTYIAGSLIWPLLLPKLGYRFCLMLGLWGYAVSMILFSAVLWSQGSNHLQPDQSYWGFSASRLLYGAFTSVLLPVAQSWSADITAPQQRLQAFSRISMQLAASRALGPVLAAGLGWIHWILLPLVLALWPILLTVLLSSAPLPATSAPTRPLLQSLRGMMPPVWLGLIALSTTALASSLQFQLSPALQILTHTDPEQLSLLLAGLLVAAAALGVGAHKLQSRHPPLHPQLRQLWIALLLTVCAFTLLNTHNPWLFVIIVLVMSIGLAWLTPIYSTQLSLHTEQQHLVAAQLGITHILGHLVGLSITALALEQSQQCVYIWLAMLGALLAVSSLSYRSQH